MSLNESVHPTLLPAQALMMVDLSATLATSLDDPQKTRIHLLDAALSVMGAEVAVLYISHKGTLWREGWAQVGMLKYADPDSRTPPAV